MFIKSYDNVLKQKGIKWNITMGLYWIRPYDYISLDSRNRWFSTKESSVKVKSVNKFFIKEVKPFNDADKLPNGEQYLEICDKFNDNIRKNNYEFNNFPEFSHVAHVISEKVNQENKEKEKEESEIPKTDTLDEMKNINKKDYWFYSPGKGASKWDKFYKDNIMGIGYSELGDLTNFKTKKDIQKTLRKNQPYSKSKKKFTHDSLALWQWANEIKIGDIIFAKNGNKEIVGYGIVESEYFYDTNYGEDFSHLIRIDWREKGNYKINKKVKVASKTLTKITDRTKIDRIKNLFKNYDEERITEKHVNILKKTFSETHF